MKKDTFYGICADAAGESNTFMCQKERKQVPGLIQRFFYPVLAQLTLCSKELRTFLSPILETLYLAISSL